MEIEFDDPIVKRVVTIPVYRPALDQRFLSADLLPSTGSNTPIEVSTFVIGTLQHEAKAVVPQFHRYHAQRYKYLDIDLEEPTPSCLLQCLVY